MQSLGWVSEELSFGEELMLGATSKLSFSLHHPVCLWRDFWKCLSGHALCCIKWQPFSYIHSRIVIQYHILSSHSFYLFYKLPWSYDNVSTYVPLAHLELDVASKLINPYFFKNWEFSWVIPVCVAPYGKIKLGIKIKNFLQVLKWWSIR